MKPIPLLICLLVVSLAISVALLGYRRVEAPAPASNPDATALVSPTESQPVVAESIAAPPTQPAETPADAPSVTDAPEQKAPPSHQAYVAKRIDELQDLSAENDAASLETILSELTNRDREIRHAAIQATMQFGSRDAIPRLLEAAAQTVDPVEKAEFQEAADYLKLPSLTEVLAQQKNRQTPIKIPAQPPRHNIPSKKTQISTAPQP